jgi:hypothetical protein
VGSSVTDSAGLVPTIINHSLVAAFRVRDLVKPVLVSVGPDISSSHGGLRASGESRVSLLTGDPNGAKP